jgi:hypothetical protein
VSWGRGCDLGVGEGMGEGVGCDRGGVGAARGSWAVRRGCYRGVGVGEGVSAGANVG